MIAKRFKILLVGSFLVLATIACANIQTFADTPTDSGDSQDSPTEEPTPFPTATLPPAIPAPVQPGAANPDEPVFISGEIPFTSPFFLSGIAEPFILLEDQAGFIARDREFTFDLAGQAIGPAELVGEGRLHYSLSLPAVPQGTLVDVDNNGSDDTGVQVFAVAYWSNTWGGPFLEERDGHGWSTAYASTLTDPENDYEIIGGTLVVWSPDDEQGFPTGFGDDGLLFTDDDPIEPIPAGYNLVDLDEEPFRVYKEAQPRLNMIEGSSSVNNYSDMSYTEAFDALFEKVSREYPFTEEEKGIDWDDLYDEFSARVADADDDNDFYRAIRDFTYAIPDAHVGVSFNNNVFFEEQGGSFGLVLTELTDGRVIVIEVIPDTVGADEGIEVGAEIIEWDGEPIEEAIRKVQPYFAPYSVGYAKQVDQAGYLTRVAPDTKVEISYQNPGDTASITANLTAEVEYDSLFAAIPSLTLDEMRLPIAGEVLDESGLGYIQITTFNGDRNLMARLWEHFITRLNDNEVPALIIDLRINGGGSGGLASQFAGYFFDEEVVISQRSYYNDETGEFEFNGFPSRVEPAPMYYGGDIALLVGPNCVSACEGFAYTVQQTGRAIIIGHYGTAGAFGEVGQGQYELPGGLTLQFPTGRPETLDGDLFIENSGVAPDIVVPITLESALGQIDSVLEAAIEALLGE